MKKAWTIQWLSNTVACFSISPSYYFASFEWHGTKNWPSLHPNKYPKPHSADRKTFSIQSMIWPWRMAQFSIFILETPTMHMQFVNQLSKIVEKLKSMHLIQTDSISNTCPNWHLQHISCCSNNGTRFGYQKPLLEYTEMTASLSTDECAPLAYKLSKQSSKKILLQVFQIANFKWQATLVPNRSNHHLQGQYICNPLSPTSRYSMHHWLDAYLSLQQKTAWNMWKYWNGAKQPPN